MAPDLGHTEFPWPVSTGTHVPTLLPVCLGAQLNSLFLEAFLPQPCQTWHFCLCFQVVWGWQEADKLRPSKFSKLEESCVLQLDNFKMCFGSPVISRAWSLSCPSPSRTLVGCGQWKADPLHSSRSNDSALAWNGYSSLEAHGTPMFWLAFPS